MQLYFGDGWVVVDGVMWYSISMDTALTERAALRKRVAESIRKHGPEHFDMENWGRNAYGERLSLFNIARPQSSPMVAFDITACGTAACLAGHALLVDPGLFGWHGLEDIAKALGLPWDAFFAYEWNAVSLGSGTMADYCYNRMDEGEDLNTARWLTVLAKLEEQ